MNMLPEGAFAREGKIAKIFHALGSSLWFVNVVTYRYLRWTWSNISAVEMLFILE